MPYLTDNLAFYLVLNVLDKWTEALHNDAHVDAIYCDFMKAFDVIKRLLRLRLLRVLTFYLILQKTLLSGYDFLRGHKQQVAVNGVFSKWQLVAYLKDLSLALCYLLHI